MPFFVAGGLFHRYGASHEQFIWDIKQDPAIVAKFAEFWGTEKLVTSFGESSTPWVWGREETGSDCMRRRV